MSPRGARSIGGRRSRQPARPWVMRTIVVLAVVVVVVALAITVATGTLFTSPR